MSNDGKTVDQILVGKKAGIKKAPLPHGFPGWEQVDTMTWEGVVRRAQRREPGFREIRKLLSDKRFDK
jgi:hypothetical protein